MAEKKPERHHRLIIQPDEGTAPVVELIDGAKKSLRVKQFTLTDSAVMSALIRAHQRERRRADHAQSAPLVGRPRQRRVVQGAASHAGLKVEWSNPAFAVTHEKSMVIDDAMALIATFNLATKYFTETRDYGIVTDDPAQVAQVIAGFEADWHRKPFEPDDDSGLLWSSNNSRHIMAWFIDTAKKELVIQHPKFVDATIVERIAAARKRGVKVRLLCGGKHGISDWDVLDTFASLRLLDRFGVKVRRQKHLKLHAKLLIIDGERAQVGLDEHRPQRLRPAPRARRPDRRARTSSRACARSSSTTGTSRSRTRRPIRCSPKRTTKASCRTTRTSCMSEPAARRAGAGPVVTLAGLALCFLQIALSSFGGGLSAWTQRIVVEQRRWLNNEQFLSAVTISRLFPGPNQVNMAIYVGEHFKGLPGALAALAGLLGVPLAHPAHARLGVLPLPRGAGAARGAERRRRRRRRHGAVDGLQADRQLPAPARRAAVRGRGVRRRQPLPSVAAAGRAGARAAGDGLVLAARRDARRRRRSAVDDGASTLLTVAAVFASLSLVSVGGGNTVLPEIHRAAVHDRALDDRSAVRRHLRHLRGRARSELDDLEPGRLQGRRACPAPWWRSSRSSARRRCSCTSPA